MLSLLECLKKRRLYLGLWVCVLAKLVSFHYYQDYWHCRHTLLIKKNKNTHKLNERNRKFSFGGKVPKQNTEISNLVENLSKLKDNLKIGDDIKRDGIYDQNDKLVNENKNLKSDVKKDGDKSVNL